MKKVIRILTLTLLIMLVTCVGVTAAFADTEENASAEVYVTISNDSDFVQGRDGTVMAHEPFTVEYFDLADYGLEKYYRLDEDDEVIEQPTVLHLLIRVLERYYAMRTLDREKDMHSNIIDVTGSPKSLWLDRFWGHDGNLMYFVNHMYPLMSERWGATADYILLEDGDDVDLAMYTDWGFYTNSAFLYFDQGMLSVHREEPTELTLLAKPTAVVNDGVDRESIPMQNETVRVSTNYGKTWTTLEEKTDADGRITLSFDKAGTYYVATGPSHANYTDAAPAICVVNVDKLTLEEHLIEIKSKLAAQIQNYKSPDLYRDAEQKLLASIVENGIAAINDADSIETAQSAYDDAVSRIDALKTKAQYDEEENASSEGGTDKNPEGGTDEGQENDGSGSGSSSENGASEENSEKPDGQQGADDFDDHKTEEDASKSDSDDSGHNGSINEENGAEEDGSGHGSAEGDNVKPEERDDSQSEENVPQKSEEPASQDGMKDVAAEEDGSPASETQDKETAGQTIAQRKKQPMKVKAVRLKKIKAVRLKKRKVVFRAVRIKKAKGELSFKIKGKKKARRALRFNKKTGKITVRKGTKKGLYKLKIRIRAAGNDKYLAGSRTVTIKVRVR